MVRFIILALFNFAVIFLGAQQVRLEHFTTDDGLPENTGQAIVQDGQGFLWIGTQNGLARYDGYEFVAFKNLSNDSTSISNNQVEAILEDRDGFIWVATRNGMNKFDPKTGIFERYFPKPDETFGQNWFGTTLLQDSNGNIWAHSFYGVFKFASASFDNVRFFPFPDQSKRNLAALTLVDSGRQIWVAVNGSLQRITDAGLDLIADFGNPVLAMNIYNEKLFTATTRGLFTLDLVSKQILPYQPQILGELFCTKLFVDLKDRLWVLTTSGIHVFQNGEPVLFLHHERQNPESLSHNLVLSVLEDNQGLFWIGTGQGLNKLDPLQDRFLRISSSSKGPVKFPDQHVEALQFANDSTLWIGTSAGLLKLELNRPAEISDLPSDKWPIGKSVIFTSKTHPELADQNIDYILPLQDDVFVGTSIGSLYKIGPENKPEKLSALPETRQLRGLYLQPGTQKLWCASGDALYVYDVEVDSSYIPDWVPDIDCTQMGFFRNELWVGSPVGIYVVDPLHESYRLYSPGNVSGILSNSMLTHTYPTDSVLWFSTFGGGISKYNPAKDEFTTFSTEQGLENNNVWCVYPDRKGNLWSSTDKGISVFNPRASLFKTYTRADGLNFTDFSMTAHALSASGELWMGNPHGLTVFNPEKLTSEPASPKVAITNVGVNYENSSAHLKSLLSGEVLVLQANEKTLSLTLAVLDFRDLNKCQIGFKLEGYNEEWVYQDALDRNVTFTNLPSGRHRLLYRAAGQEGSWGAVNEISIQVIPPFYKTLWFRILAAVIMVLIIAVVIFAINRRRYQKRIMQLQTAQKIQQERERISKDLHDYVGAHLTRIVTDLDILELKMTKTSNEEKLEQIETTRGFTSNTIQLLRDTIWAINKDYYSVEEFSQKARAFLEQYLGNLMLWKLETHVAIQRQLSPNEVLNLLRILQEATQNMLKYAKADRFEVQINSGKNLILKILDNGVGMEHSDEKEGHYGLVNMKKRAKDIGADFEIRTSTGSGVRISVELVG